jgi:hypothetical protein
MQGSFPSLRMLIAGAVPENIRALQMGVHLRATATGTALHSFNIH